jgi:hypothetical protein
VVFNFSEAMDPTATTATFYNDSTFSTLATSEIWSPGNTVLTCTPSPAFPSNTTILWDVSGQTPGGTPLGGVPVGTFTTIGTGGGGGGSGTNQYTTFTVGDAVYYQQTSTSAPTVDTNFAYLFLANVILASNRTAISATVELPSTTVTNLTHNPINPAQFFLDAANTNQSALDTTFGNGSYIFDVVAADSNQDVTVKLSASLLQPNAPQITSYTAAQSVNPAQAFTLTWDPFTGAAATDFVVVIVGNVYSTASPGNSNALPGTATSFQIPADTLQPSTNYLCAVGFYRYTGATNKAGDYFTGAYRGAITEFNLATIGGGTTTAPVLADASVSGNSFNFNVTSGVGQSLTIQYNTSATLGSNQWQTLLTTNSATGVVQVNVPINPSIPHIFYRTLTGK